VSGGGGRVVGAAVGTCGVVKGPGGQTKAAVSNTS